MDSRETASRRRSAASSDGLRRHAPARLLAAWLLAVLLAPAAVANATTAAPGALAPVVLDAAAVAPLTSGQLAHRLSSEVYGFLPYWEIDSGTDAYLHYDLVTDIALFSVGLTAGGAIDTTSRGYAAATGSTAATIIAHAHAVGVRVDLTFTSFGLAKNDAFFADPTAMAAGVTSLAGLVTQLGLDGVNVDVESLDNVYFPQYGTFVGQLRTALQATNPIARVSVATNGAQSGGSMAVQALANGADRVFLMGYSYRTAGTSPVGSISPITRSDGKSLTYTLDLYAADGVPANRVLLGLPYYGWSWQTDSGALHANNLGSEGAFIPGTDLASIPAGTTVNTDPVEGSRWYATQDPTTSAWSETYYDDPSTLTPNYALAIGRGLAGIGIWALGYDRGLSDYWAALAGTFGTIRVAGTDRYGTAAAVAAAAFAPGVDTAYVATGLDFPDAVSASAAAGGSGSPLFLVTTTSIPDATAAGLARVHPNRIVVVGGPGVIADSVLASLVAYAPGGVVRAAGVDRYATAAALSQLSHPTGAPVAYLATGANFPDALAAGPAAVHDGGALLLTDPTSLPATTATELVRLNPARIVIAGGTAAISQGVADAVQALLPAAAITRLAGADRYGTAAALAGVFTAHVPVVYVASGLGFADAVSGAAAAGAQGGALLLTDPITLPAADSTTIAALGPAHAVVLGGSAVVSDAVLAGVRQAVATAP